MHQSFEHPNFGANQTYNNLKSNNSDFIHTGSNNGNSNNKNNNNNIQGSITWRFLDNNQQCSQHTNEICNQLPVKTKTTYSVGNIIYVVKKIDQYTVKHKTKRTKRWRILKSSVCYLKSTQLLLFCFVFSFVDEWSS